MIKSMFKMSPEDRITAEDLGSDQPASKGTTMFSMAKNRRVEFIIIK